MKTENLLNSKQTEEMNRIIKAAPDAIEMAKRLRIYFGTFAEQLQKQGVEPEFLAYAVVHAYTEEEARRARNN
jgi:hypothetical protein